MDDPYKALGVGKDASADQIKKAYRKIAKSDHPDLNPDPKAAERFKAAAAAYDLLKDPEQRARFDRGEIDASGAEKPQHRYYRDFAQGADNPYREYAGAGGAGYEDLSGVFEDLFGRTRGGGAEGFGRQGFGNQQGFGGRNFDMRGGDHRFNLQVDFITAAKGGTTRITLPEGGTVDVKIPEGARDGQTIRLRGKGGEGMGKGEAGDALLTLTVAEHPVFKRDGDDIHVTLPITIDEAVLGGKVAAPTIDGPVNVTVPKGASSGRKLRLKGRGVNNGDEIIELRIVMPETIDSELSDFIESWRKTHGYDPRRNMKI